MDNITVIKKDELANYRFDADCKFTFGMSVTGSKPENNYKKITIIGNLELGGADLLSICNQLTTSTSVPVREEAIIRAYLNSHTIVEAKTYTKEWKCGATGNSRAKVIIVEKVPTQLEFLTKNVKDAVDGSEDKKFWSEMLRNFKVLAGKSDAKVIENTEEEVERLNKLAASAAKKDK